MIATGTMLRVLDNSGARVAQCIRISKNRKTANVGDRITVVIKRSKANKKIRTHQIHKALVVRNTTMSRRKDGSYIKFIQGACVLVNKQNAPIGKRILGPVNKDLRLQGHLKIISISSIAI
jgi:large subunit ribosomal protein L14